MIKWLITITAYLICIPSILYSAYTNDITEFRYCGPPKRDQSGTIIRSYKVYTAFRKLHLCPSTNLPTGSCPGWQVDHVIPLASCGCDILSNLQWLPIEIKTCKESYCKDRFERTIYKCNPINQ